jgi:hypothetical protein
MRNWVFFIVISVLLGFGNEWLKLNINFQLACHGRWAEWAEWSIEQKREAIHSIWYVQANAFYSQPVSWNVLLERTFEELNIGKWLVPILFSLCFFVLELIFTPILFSGMTITRKHVLGYYSMVFFVVALFYLGFAFAHLDGMLNISRKLWVLLQGPSLFVLLLFYQKMKKHV